MKNRNRINDLDDLEQALSRLHSRIRANRAETARQWASMKENFVKLSWNSVKDSFGFRPNTGISGQLNDLGSTVLNILLKWLGKFK